MMDHGFFDGPWGAPYKSGQPYIFSAEFKEHLRRLREAKAAEQSRKES